MSPVLVRSLMWRTHDYRSCFPPGLISGELPCGVRAFPLIACPRIASSHHEPLSLGHSGSGPGSLGTESGRRCVSNGTFRGSNHARSTCICGFARYYRASHADGRADSPRVNAAGCADSPRVRHAWQLSSQETRPGIRDNPTLPPGAVGGCERLGYWIRRFRRA